LTGLNNHSDQDHRATGDLPDQKIEPRCMLVHKWIIALNRTRKKDDDVIKHYVF
jgi:hypothetical protein